MDAEEPADFGADKQGDDHDDDDCAHVECSRWSVGRAAAAVLVGRAYLYGLGAAGERGGEECVEGFDG